MKFLCDQCKTKYQIADEKAVGKTLRMKCRKCGHLIEVRATAAVASSSPADKPATFDGPDKGQRPASKSAAALASSLASARPATGAIKSERPGALAGAFKSTVRDEETSAPFDMSDLGGANDEWYVAVNGVPVGPVRLGEIRRKAANGAVNEDSLAWQEGLDEWRPIRTFPDLATAVRDAIASGRASLAPAPEPRPSLGPQSRNTSLARIGHAPQPPAASRRAQITPIPEPAAARSNVVSITARVATAERLTPQYEDFAVPLSNEPAAPDAVLADPLAALTAPSAPSAFATPAVVVAKRLPDVEPLPTHERSRPFPWIQVAMVLCAVAFGVTGALVAFSRPQPTQQIIYREVPAPQPVPSGIAVPSATAVAPAAPAAVETAGGSPKSAIASNVGPRTGGGSGAAAAAPKGLDLSSLTQGRVAVGDNAGEGDGPRSPGQCLTSGQVQMVVGNHQVGVRRTCWDRNPSNKPAANVQVSLTVGPDGSVQNVSANGDDPSVAKCIENDARSWRFPALGCSQAVSIPFHFVRQ